MDIGLSRLPTQHYAWVLLPARVPVRWLLQGSPASARPKLYMRRYRRAMKLGEKIGADNIFYSVHAAVEAILQREGRTPDSVLGG